MNSTVPPHVLVVRKEDKEQALKDFISLDISARKCQATGQANSYLLVVQSLASPVAKALAALSPEIARSGVTVRAILTRREPGFITNDSLASPLLAVAGGWRLLSDIRMLDAHEMLVLGNASAWIGDCMRRDPSKRDAFERFSHDCALTATWARMSFERLWAKATPLLPSLTLERTVHQAGEFDVNASAAALSEVAPAVTVSTRH